MRKRDYIITNAHSLTLFCSTKNVVFLKMIRHRTRWQQHQQGGQLSTWQIISPLPPTRPATLPQAMPFILLHILKHPLPPPWFPWISISNFKILISTTPPSHRNINLPLLLLQHHPHVQLHQVPIQWLVHLFLSMDVTTMVPLTASTSHHIQRWLLLIYLHPPPQLIYPLKHSLHNTSLRWIPSLLHILLILPISHPFIAYIYILPVTSPFCYSFPCHCMSFLVTLYAN